MRRRHAKTVLGLLVVCLIICTNVVHAFSINLKDGIEDLIDNKVVSLLDDRLNESSQECFWSYEDVMNSNLEYKKKWIIDYEDYQDILYVLL